MLQNKYSKNTYWYKFTQKPWVRSPPLNPNLSRDSPSHYVSNTVIWPSLTMLGGLQYFPNYQEGLNSFSPTDLAFLEPAAGVGAAGLTIFLIVKYWDNIKEIGRDISELASLIKSKVTAKVKLRIGRSLNRWYNEVWKDKSNIIHHFVKRLCEPKFKVSGVCKDPFEVKIKGDIAAIKVRKDSLHNQNIINALWEYWEQGSTPTDKKRLLEPLGYNEPLLICRPIKCVCMDNQLGYFPYYDSFNLHWERKRSNLLNGNRENKAYSIMRVTFNIFSGGKIDPTEKYSSREKSMLINIISQMISDES